MRVKEWSVDLDNKIYKIEFYPSLLFKFVYQLIINDELIKNVKHKLHRRGAEYNFDINGHKAVIIMRTNKLRSSYALEIDGVVYEPEESI